MKCVLGLASRAGRMNGLPMVNLRRHIALSKHPVARGLRGVYHALMNFTLPAPRVIARPMLWTFLAIRTVYYFAARTLVCEPLFKAYCTRYGRGVRTGVFVHWVVGQGRIILGDGVLVDGKCAFSFAARHSELPTLEIGDRTEVGHGCSFTIGKSITVGRHSRIAMDCLLFDTGGHPLEADSRRAGLPASSGEVRPIVIGDDVWIGQRSIIFPGTRIGDGAIISAGSVVRGTVAPYTLIAGNPARVVASLPRPQAPDQPFTNGSTAVITRSNDDTAAAPAPDRGDHQR